MAAYKACSCVLTPPSTAHPLNCKPDQVFAEAEKHREEAEYQAKLRGEKLQESRDAYQAGHKANAHELSVEVMI